jgi:hypothetical protein
VELASITASFLKDDNMLHLLTPSIHAFNLQCCGGKMQHADDANMWEAAASVCEEGEEA